ncbi:MAG: hypothetical protein AAB864_00460 [Patescibacteria group bacterium]
MKKIALYEARGPLNQLMDCLSGENGDLWLGSLTKWLRSPNSWDGYPVWKTITLSGGRDLKRYRTLLKLNNYGDEIVDDFLGKLPAVQEAPQEVDLVELSARELGLRGPHILYVDICNRGVVRGLELCLIEQVLKLALVLSARDVPREETPHGLQRLVAAMEPLVLRDAFLSRDLQHMVSLWPNGKGVRVGLEALGTSGPEDVSSARSMCPDYHRFIFVKPRID